MIHYSDEAIIEGLRLRSDYIIKYMYQEMFPMIRYLVVKNSGNDEDAEDVFQDGLIIVFKKIRDQQLELTSSFRTYIYSVCRNIWLQKLNKRKQFAREFSDVETFIDLPDKVDQFQEEEMEKYRLYQQHFLTLGEDCQKVLLLFMKKLSLKDIAAEMGYKTEKYAKTRKYLCKEELKKRIINDPKCHKFLSDDK
ncbi:MAG: sigma-70 family RNA polymerase sigma factor [Lentimicrobium sp.]|jgi:RNA polymerase sigma factor (sigma-70 family)|nr:sigma-70 family RNA polymerase sigma factor [Lentimicrobium sp.]